MIAVKKYFPQDWNRVHREFSELEKKALRIEQYEKMKMDASSLRAALKARSRDLAWFDVAMNSISTALSRPVIDELYKRAARVESEITVAQRPTGEEKGLARMIGQNPTTAAIVLRTLKGLRIFRSGNDPRSVASKIELSCKSVVLLRDPFAAAVKTVAQDTASLPSELERMDRLLRFGREFFHNDNLALIPKLSWAKQSRLTWIRIETNGVVTHDGFQVHQV